MKRGVRLQSAVSWLKKFDGSNVLRVYCKHYGVDWRCAAMELAQLGVELDPEYLRRRDSSERSLANFRKRRREQPENQRSSDFPREYDSLLDACSSEDYVALYAMECRRDEIDFASYYGEEPSFRKNGPV